MNADNLKTYFWALLNLLLAGLFVNLVFFVMPTISRFRDTLYAPRTMSVSAEGKATVVPDVARTSFSVVAQGKNPDELARENNEKIAKAIDFVKAQGIDAKDVKTTGYNLSPNYRFEEKTGRSTIDGYTLTQTVSVKVRDIGKIGTVIGGLTPLGINQIGGVSFTIDDPEKYLAEARNEAFMKAREKAAQMASVNGAGLGRLLSVSEYGGGQAPYYARAESFGVGGDMLAAPAPKIEPGSEEVTVQVTMTYELK